MAEVSLLLNFRDRKSMLFVGAGVRGRSISFYNRFGVGGGKYLEQKKQ